MESNGTFTYFHGQQQEKSKPIVLIYKCWPSGLRSVQHIRRAESLLKFLGCPLVVILALIR